MEVLSSTSASTVNKSLPRNTLLFSAAISGSVYLFCKLMKMNNSIKTSNAVIVITGCDSGLGYSLVHHCLELGFYVFAGVLHLDSAGAESLNKLKDTGKLTIFAIDVTSPEDVNQSLQLVSNFLSNKPEYFFHSIVNNAGIMIFGEFEWLTDEQIFQQLNVNLLGAMRVTKTFLPILRKYKGRIINISSHCAYAGLPGLSVYAASKSGLQTWCDAIRVEYAKYGVKVISIIPGSFFTQSNILVNQAAYAQEMKTSMHDEARDFYGEYFCNYQKYVSSFSNNVSLQRVKDSRLYRLFSDAVVSKYPQYSYTNSPLRYSIYHFLFGVTPTSIRDWLVQLFINMPVFKK